jgi:hypothetical protein
MIKLDGAESSTAFSPASRFLALSISAWPRMYLSSRKCCAWIEGFHRTFEWREGTVGADVVDLGSSCSVDAKKGRRPYLALLAPKPYGRVVLHNTLGTPSAFRLCIETSSQGHPRAVQPAARSRARRHSLTDYTRRSRA